jgi:hypothetical protein
MSRTTLPFYAEDISAFARSLNAQLTNSDHDPSHVELLNMLARSAGFRNFQHFRAQADAREHLESPRRAAAPVDFALVQTLTKYFDASGCLSRWPSKFSHREPCIWVMWSRLAPREIYTERQINEFLQANHLFGDHVLLRRQLIDLGLVTRTADGREYRRVERRPRAEVVELIRCLTKRAA